MSRSIHDTVPRPLPRRTNLAALLVQLLSMLDWTCHRHVYRTLKSTRFKDLLVKWQQSTTTHKVHPVSILSYSLRLQLEATSKIHTANLQKPVYHHPWPIHSNAEHSCL